MGDRVNTIIRYLLEETSKCENNYTHYLYTLEKDVPLFNTNSINMDDLRREIHSLQTCVRTRFSQMEQSVVANLLLVFKERKAFTSTIVGQIKQLEE